MWRGGGLWVQKGLWVQAGAMGAVRGPWVQARGCCGFRAGLWVQGGAVGTVRSHGCRQGAVGTGGGGPWVQ